jgi:hypothetical protein
MVILPISESQVARIIGISHQCTTNNLFLKKKRMGFMKNITGFGIIFQEVTIYGPNHWYQ